MVGGRPGMGEWKHLCGLWSGDVETGEGGLWGLRLGINGRVSAYVVWETVGGSGGVSVAFREPGMRELTLTTTRTGRKDYWMLMLNG